MRILFLGLNYAPEEIGIARYSTAMCEELVRRGHEVRAVAGKPYYPDWSVPAEFRGGGARHSEENGVELTRVSHYVPSDPSGAKRIFHHLTFALNALVPMLKNARSFQPDIVLTVAPSTIGAPVARLAARIAGARSWLHIQDFEVGAALATGLVNEGGLVSRLANAFERWVVTGFDRVTSISLEMCRKVEEYGVPQSQIGEFRNWTELDQIAPLDRPSKYRDEWNIETPHVALYSGNIANKQGIDILVDVARRLARRSDLTFVICGNGPNRDVLESRAAGLTNIQFHDLQPMAQLNELMNLATIHLLPQKASAADLVLPSKLTNMLASGRPVVATAHEDTGLAREVAGCGILVSPENPGAFADAIEKLMDDRDFYETSSRRALVRADRRWNKFHIFDALERSFGALVNAHPGQKSL